MLTKQEMDCDNKQSNKVIPAFPSVMMGGRSIIKKESHTEQNKCGRGRKHFKHFCEEN